MVQLLLENGARINTVDDYGRTPLHRASTCGDEVMVQLLLENGADINAKCRGYTALDHAVENRHGAVVQLLEAALIPQ